VAGRHEAPASCIASGARLKGNARARIIGVLSLLAGVVWSGAGCQERSPEYVFVAGRGYSQVVTAWSEHDVVKVNQPVVIHASRISGPFERVKRTSVDGRTRWWKREPPHQEPEVSGNLRWVVSPEGTALFNTRLRPDHAREITFSKPGQYVLRGYSAVWNGSPTASNEVRISVLP
jgi:hypothetical protein